MSETPGEWQTSIEKDSGERVGSVDAEPQASAPTRVSWRPTIGRMLWRLSVVLLALGTICAGALSAVTLWVLFGFPPEPRNSDADTLGAQFEARKGASLEGVGPLNLTGASQQKFGREPGAQGRPVAEASEDRSYRASGTSSAAGEPAKAAKETQSQPGAGADQPQLARTEPQDRRPAARQQEISGTLTDLRPRTQCNVSLCAATYKSFNAALRRRAAQHLRAERPAGRCAAANVARSNRSEVRDAGRAGRGRRARDPERGRVCSGRSPMQHRSLRGHLRVFPCRGLHLPAARRRTATHLRAIGRQLVPSGPVGGGFSSKTELRRGLRVAI
jgi:hypothetical protein